MVKRYWCHHLLRLLFISSNVAIHEASVSSDSEDGFDNLLRESDIPPEIGESVAPEKFGDESEDTVEVIEEVIELLYNHKADHIIQNTTYGTQTIEGGIMDK